MKKIPINFNLNLFPPISQGKKKTFTPSDIHQSKPYTMLRRTLIVCRPEPTSFTSRSARYEEEYSVPQTSEVVPHKPELIASSKETVGWVGLGDMGMGLSWKLIKDPNNTVHIWNRNERKLRAFSQHADEALQRFVHQRQSLLDVPRFANIIFVSLANIRAVRETLLDRDDSLIYNAKPGTIIVDHSTVDIETTNEINEIASARGVHYLDAPIAGSTELAQSGNISVMVGGDQLAFRRVAKLISKYAHCVEYMGESGSGTATKIVHEATAAMQAVVSAETALLAKSLGLTDLDSLNRVFDASLSGSNMLRRNSLYFPEQFDAKMKLATSLSISRTAKNLAILDTHMSKVGLDSFLPMTKTAQRIVRDCGEAGGHDADISSVLHFLNKEEPNLSVHWDVPVTDVDQNRQLQQSIDEANNAGVCIYFRLRCVFITNHSFIFFSIFAP